MRWPRAFLCDPERGFLRMPREERSALARLLKRLLARPPALENARACLRHYADEIREYIEEMGAAPASLDRYTCGADYQHEANIDPELFRVTVERINSVAAHGIRGEQLCEVIDLVIKNL